MKKIMKILFMLCLVFVSKTVFADANINVGDSTTISNNAAEIKSCVANNSNVSVEFDKTQCKVTGVSVGDSIIEIEYTNAEKKSVDIKVVSGNQEIGEEEKDIYENVTTGPVECSSLGLFRKDLEGIFTIFKIVAPILVVAMSTYDFIKALTGKVDGEAKKVFMKLIKRLVFAMILFFLPTILDFFLGIVDEGYSTCIR